VILMSRERGADYERLRHLVEAEQLTPALDHTYPLERAADAVRRLEDGTVRGKVSITM
jgi:NADPH:quinone reductase-like Zn-dependent oxidoreductase